MRSKKVMSLKRLGQELKRHKRYLISTHTSVEGDALGSELAMYWLLKALGKSVTIVDEERVPDSYAFLPGAEKIIPLARFRNVGSFDACVLVDCSDPSRCGKVQRIMPARACRINIDHHISNTYFGHVNVVDTSVSSCTEIIYRLFRTMRIPLTKQVATALYVGILTDTGSFRYSNTSARTHAVVSHLLSFGLDVRGIYATIHENIPFRQVRELAEVLSSVKRMAGGRAAWCYIKGKLLRERLSFDLSERVLGCIRAIKGIEVAILFRKAANNKIRVNFRSTGSFNVNAVASAFGGGGHKAASGCTVSGTAREVIPQVLRLIRRHLS